MAPINERSRSANVPAAGDEDTNETGDETPRSGVATPQPDLHDKRLPGIMSYFSQVSSKFWSSSVGEEEADLEQDESRRMAIEPNNPPQSHVHPPTSLSGPVAADCTCRELSSQDPEAPSFIFPVPPTCRLPSHSREGPRKNISSTALSAMSQTKHSISMHRSASGPAITVVTTHPVLASHISARSCTVPATPARCESPTSAVAPEQRSSIDNIKEKLLTSMVEKSGPTTPTRALSAAHASHLDDKDDAPPSGAQTPRPRANVAQVPSAKGRLTIKIIEAKGLRRSKDPYVVAVFQRSELISGGPRTFNDEEEEMPPPPAAAAAAAAAPMMMGGIPIQRQGSDSGRSMAIPMKSRQSSNTSVGDYQSFRTKARRSFTHPKWDAEAIFDVVDADLHVDISIYDHGTNGEIFLGHVGFDASTLETVTGWYSLRGNADTMVENTPTGEILVEATYQTTDRKHYGPEDFEILRLIGKGTFGQVYQVRKKDTKRIYAMKVLSKKVIVQKKEVAHTVGERNILVRTAMSDSPFIVGLKFSFQTPSDLYLVTDYMSGGELFWHLQKEGRFDEKRAKFYIAELILAIQHLHNNDIVYRDLKPENILLDANGHIALCDFGLSKANLTKNDTTNTFCGTTEYLAPEVLLDESGYTKMVDFWSLGVLVFEMCCGWSPFYAEDTQQMYKNIAFGKVRFPRDTLSVEGRNFVKGLLNRNPKHRLGATKDAEELKEHPFFADIRWDILGKKLITPPFKPQLKSETDVSYFDPEFTNALNMNGSLNERAAALARGFATSTPLSPSVQANFQGFTFVDESSLDDHMGGRGPFEDDDEMDDEMDHRDDSWDDLGDIDPRHTNRMSGIERTNTNDEHMFGGAHFEGL
ncbi:Serine threonine-protein kinase sck1 [Zalerion maritima]|uniref:non-specific serine/threonine protein kinase n=1 Tax=Zalerion maritima TaxID=339359 RepID=A0AAD5RSE1_9PEZI|nr:Serine threonine-protein kinase sck1 [Zalerion maritima]